MLMRRAHARQSARHDLAALGHKLPKQPVILVVDVFDLLDAEFANLLAPKEFASARTTFAPGSARPASGTAKSRTISARPSAFATRPFGRCRLFWCFRLVCHNSPLNSVASDQWSVASKNLRT